MDDVVAVVGDLFFQARIASAAKAADRTVRFVGQGFLPAGFDLALVDLDSPDAIEWIRTLKQRADSPIVAFGPHLDVEKRKAARAAGAHRVLAKSKFVTELPGMLRNS